MRFRELLDIFEKLPAALVIAAAYGLVSFVGWCDYKMGYELSVAVFYLIPVSLITWRVGARSGLLMVMVSTVA